MNSRNRAIKTLVAALASAVIFAEGGEGQQPGSFAVEDADILVVGQVGAADTSVSESAASGCLSDESSAQKPFINGTLLSKSGVIGENPKFSEPRPAPSTTLTFCATVVKPFVFRKELDEDQDGASGAGFQELAGSNSGFQEFSANEFLRHYQGYSVDIIVAAWKLKFRHNDLRVRLYKTFTEAVYAVRTNKCDFGATAITHTGYRSHCNYDTCPHPEPEGAINNTHLCCLDFTHGYFRDGMTMMMRMDHTVTRASMTDAFWQPGTLLVICTLTISLLISGHLVWWLEKKRNKHMFPSSYLDGVDDGIWWSFVTMTTVGYGDKVPISIMGRLIACVWMITGIILFSVVNGSIILVMSLPRVPIDLTGHLDPRLNESKVCSRYGAFEEYLGEHKNAFHNVTYMHSMAECYEQLVTGQVDAVFYDRLPMLADVHSGNNDDGEPLPLQIPSGVEIGRSFQDVEFAVAMPLNGTRNSAMKAAVDELLRGVSVYSKDISSMKFGFSINNARMRWMPYNQELDQTFMTENFVSDETWISVHTAGAFTISITVLYILVQFGGMWIRWFKRRRTCMDSQGECSLKSKPAKKSRWSLMEALENTSLANNINKLQDDVEMMRQATAGQQEALDRMHRASVEVPRQNGKPRGEIISDLVNEAAKSSPDLRRLAVVPKGVDPRRVRWWEQASSRFSSLSES